MNKLFKHISGLLLLICTSNICICQAELGRIKFNIKNCKSAQVFKLYYLDQESILIDSINISGKNEEEIFSLKTLFQSNRDEFSYLLSIYPLGMDIDIVLGQNDRDVTANFILPSPNTEGIFTTPIIYTGSTKASEFSDLNTTIWAESIEAGNRYQLLSKINLKNSDSLQIEWYKSNITYKINLIRKTNCLSCARTCFYKILSLISVSKSNFDIKIYSKKMIQDELNEFENRFLEIKKIKQFMHGVQSDIDGMQW